MCTPSLVTESRSSLTSLHLHHLSSITVFLSHFPLCLIFIIPLPPRQVLSHLHLLLCTYIFLVVCATAQTLVVVGFQMVWLAQGSELTPGQLILSYLKPQGVQEATCISSTIRGRGQERENCVTPEPVI